MFFKLLSHKESYYFFHNGQAVFSSVPIQTTLYIKQINYCIYSVLKLTICLIVPTTYLGRRTESVTRLTRPERAAGNLPSSDPANRISVGAGLCRCHHRRPLRSLPRRTRTEATSRLKQKVGYFCVFFVSRGGAVAGILLRC